MKIYKIPENLKCIVFDIDGTLYTNREFVAEQIDVQIRHWAELQGKSHDEARKEIQDYRKTYALENGGKSISLANAFLHFGIDIETSIEWRNKLLEPEKYLSRDKKLAGVLEELKQKYILICLTNNPVFAAGRILKAVGINECFEHIVGLDTLKKSKPSKESLLKVCEITQTPFDECLSVGDRYDIDLSLPLQLGMGGVLVNDSNDIIELAEVLKFNLKK